MQNGGVPCGDLEEQQDCNVHACPVDCLESVWGSWEGCTKSCGGGINTHRRTEERGALSRRVGSELCKAHEVEADELEAIAAEGKTGQGAAEGQCGEQRAGGRARHTRGQQKVEGDHQHQPPPP